jgi:hypothetical protein
LPLPNGIRIQTTVTGTIVRPLALPHGIDVVELMYVSPTGGTPSLIWQLPGSDPRQYYQIPISLQPSAASTTSTIVLSAIGHWSTHPTAIGLQVPPGTDITLNTLTLRGWSGGEKLLEAIRCFWTFDVFKAHSINFLWGPLLCSSPVARENLYHQQPPAAHSGMRTIYAILAAGAAVIAIRWWFTRDRRRAVRQILVLMLALWVILDVRMGLELQRNWLVDVQSFLREPVGRRVFRTIRFLPDFATTSRGILADQPRYVLLSPTTDTFMNFMRYQTYPSRPVEPRDGSGASIWMVYERPDLPIDAEGRITEDGVPLSPPGSVIHEFMKGTYIFRATPSGSQQNKPASESSQQVAKPAVASPVQPIRNNQPQNSSNTPRRRAQP